MIEKQTLIGIILLVVSGSLLGLALWRFSWLQRKIPFLLYWGRWPWRFPATRMGFVAGNSVGLSIGCFCLDSKFHILSKDTWLVILLASFIIAVAGAIHDYVLHKRRLS